MKLSGGRTAVCEVGTDLVAKSRVMWQRVRCVRVKRCVEAMVGSFPVSFRRCSRECVGIGISGGLSRLRVGGSWELGARGGH